MSSSSLPLIRPPSRTDLVAVKVPSLEPLPTFAPEAASKTPHIFVNTVEGAATVPPCRTTESK